MAQALKAVAPPVVLADAQTAEYQAFAQSLREMALLEATMQAVTESGQRVLHPSHGRQASQVVRERETAINARQTRALN